MTEVISLFWRWNFPVGMILFQIIMCLQYGRRKNFLLKYIAFAIIIFLIGITMTHDWEWEGSLIKASNILVNVPGRVLIMISIAAIMYFCYKISLWSAVFLTTVAITLHSIHFSLYKIIEAITIGQVTETTPGPLSVITDVIVLITFLFVTGLVFWKRKIIRIDEYSKDRIVLAISLIILVLTDFINLYQFANDPYVNFGITLILSRLFDIIFNAMTLYMIYNIIVKKNLQIEQQKMEDIMEQRSKQYAFSQQIMDSINLKSHDLKKQIRYLEKDEISRNEVLQSLKDAVARYDTVIKTNNDALSTILSEKSMVCYNNNIKLNCLVYVEDLEFIKDIDIYTMFANLLDNAIEALIKTSEKHPSILVVIKQKENFLSIHTENHFSGDLNIKDGKFQTTKKQTNKHGFGVESISNIVEYYNGSITFNTNCNIFTVNILIPIP